MRREFIGLMGKLSCEFEEDGDRLIAELAGKADLHTSRELGKLLAAYLDKGKNEILLDLDNLEYLDSSTLAQLLEAQKKARAAGGELKLIKPQKQPREVLQVSGFLNLFEIYDSRQKALDSF